MSYKNDHLVVISNKYGKAGSEAKVQLFETYDKIRDITVSGPQLGGTSLGGTGNFLLNIAKFISPSAFMPILGTEMINIPGTSYSSPITGSNSVAGSNSSFGINELSTYSGFPTGGAASMGIGQISSILSGVGANLSSLQNSFTIGGVPTGGSASMVQVANAAGATAGTASGAGFGNSFIIPVAGVVSGIGGLLSAMSPYFGPYGLAGSFLGNLAMGTGSAVQNSYQHVSGRILNNADTILSTKVKNIETVVKMLNTQSDIIKKMLKESMDGDSKAIQNL